MCGTLGKARSLADQHKFALLGICPIDQRADPGLAERPAMSFCKTRACHMLVHLVKVFLRADCGTRTMFLNIWCNSIAELRESLRSLLPQTL
jgi:hypothetical protein